MRKLIRDVFAGNNFNRFRWYCDKNNIVFFDDLQNFDFDLLLDIKGIGKKKFEEIIERFNRFIENEDHNSEIIRSLESTKNEYRAYVIDVNKMEPEIQGASINTLILFSKIMNIKKSQISTLLRETNIVIKDLDGILLPQYPKNHFENSVKLLEMIQRPLCEVVNEMVELIR